MNEMRGLLLLLVLMSGLLLFALALEYLAPASAWPGW
jgi:hypothetical protein